MKNQFNPQKAVIWTDPCLLVIQKPPGLLTIPDGYSPFIPHLRDLLEPVYGPLYIVHRLDRDTSGVIILARTAEAHCAMCNQFQNRQVMKNYHAIVVGQPNWKETDIDQPLLVGGGRTHRTIVDTRHGQPARTSLRLLESFKGYSLIQAQPHTGYTHQVRAHLACAGFPIAADPLYGDGQPILLSQVKRGFRRKETQEPPLIGRTALHAHTLQCCHPLTNEAVTFTAPYPKDFKAAICQLRKCS